MRLRPWSNKKINESHEPLIVIPESILRLTPHPYMSLGAPYSNGLDPWVLRKGVVSRLIRAQQFLTEKNSHWQLALFDAWRPISVQKFMFEYTIKNRCISRGIDIGDNSSREIINEIVNEVSRFWAQPSSDPSTPPPHSTGAAIDLTLADLNGIPIDLGGEIDFIGEISNPDFYKKYSLEMPDSKFHVFHSRRSLLKLVMAMAGFVQHPNEWWHFSYGDQLWCWDCNHSEAIYGSVLEVSKDKTFSSLSLVT